MIHYTNRVLGTKQKFICISRPRRFGKSITAEMLSAYYDSSVDSHPLFSKLKIAVDSSFEQNINKYDVLFFNIQSFLSRSDCALNMVEYLEFRVIQELAERYPDLGLESEPHLTSALEKIYSVHRKGFVFIIDEWDCVFREKKSDVDAQTKYLDFLRDLLKDKVYVKLAYMTGILPIKKQKTQSALNNFKDYSMLYAGPLASYIGFTEDEVQQLCDVYNEDYEEVRRWYDGYKLGRYHIYNPNAVVNLMLDGSYQSYWSSTASYEAIVPLINMDFDGLKEAIITMLSGNQIQVDVTSFQNDTISFVNKDDVITYLIHLGYLAYDQGFKIAVIPNEEIRQELVKATRRKKWNELVTFERQSEQLLEDTLNMDGKAVAKGIEEIHSEYTSAIQYNNENSLSSVLSIAYLSAIQYYFKPVREFPAGRGFADFVFIPKPEYIAYYPALVVELKWNKSADTALQQIEERCYPDSVRSYTGSILLVGINYDTHTKEHTCLIKKYIKES